MAVPTLMELAVSGAHYGHHRSLVYPKARGALFAIKNNIALINLEITQQQIIKAAELFQQVASTKGEILFIGTKKMNRQALIEIAQKVNAHFIAERWFGGFLTNFETFKTQMKAMANLEEKLNDPHNKMDKKERLIEERRLARFNRFFEGVKKMTRLPDLIILTSAAEDKIALNEARRLNIATIAIADMKINPEEVTVAIPANDDAPKAVRLILESIISPDTTKTSTAPKRASKTEKKEEKVNKSAKSTRVAQKKQPKSKATKSKEKDKKSSPAKETKNSSKTKTKNKKSK